MSSVTEKWEMMQLKTFTKWVNMHLAKVGASIESIAEDFEDGINLIKLLEVIGEANLGRYNTKPRLRLQKIENVSTALNFIKQRGVNLVSIGPEDIVDKNRKLTLGMVWTIILRFAISDLSEEGLSAKQGLLLWCQRKTQGYRDVDVQDFQDSFKDGLAFCAIIHKHRPDLIDYDSLSKDNARENLDLAFDVAEKNLGIPKLLDTEDMVSLPRPDERSVMTSCAALYKVFSAYDKVELAGQRMGKFLRLMKAVQDMINDYEARARALREFIDAKVEYFGSANLDEVDYQGVRTLMAEFKAYRRDEKGSRVGEQDDLASLLSNIQIKLKSFRRPAYVPPEGLSTHDLAEGMDALSEAERKYRGGLSARMRKILDELRHAFADPANAFYDKIVSFKGFLVEELEGEIADQKAQFEAKLDELKGIAGDLDVILAAEQACEAANIEENEYSDHCHEDLLAVYNQLIRSYEKKIAFFNAQLSEAEGGIPAEKMQEFQESFDHFDKDHNQSLERLEFFACLASLGLCNVDFTGQNPEAERIFQEVSEGTGIVTFDQYVAFVSTLAEDTLDPQQIAECLQAIADGKDFVTEADMNRASIEPELIEYVKSTLPPKNDGYDFSSLLQ